MNGRLKVSYDKSDKEVTIIGDKEGLEFLSDVCLSVIGKGPDPSGHIHLMPEMNNVCEGSLRAVVVHSSDPDDYQIEQSPSLAGRILGLFFKRGRS